MAEFDGQTDEGAPVNGYSSDVSVETRSDNEPCDVNNSTRLTDQQRLKAIEETANYLLSRTKHRPRIAVILGTGLGGLASLLHSADEFTYCSIPNFTQTSVKGHAGRLLFGQLADKPVACMQGRIHAYEGHSMWQLTFPVRVLHAIGVQVLIVTNASGSLRSDFRPGDIAIIKDHINLPGLVGLNPFCGLSDDRFGDRFPAMSTAYDGQLRALADQVAVELNMKSFVQHAVYVYQTGPCLETVAECRMARCLGGDVIGMSTCPEVMVARHGQRPMRCVGLSLVTNQCPMDYDVQSESAISLLDEVLQTADQ